MTERRVGVLGGMFDPIHLGHEAAVMAVQQALSLDQVILVPSRQPPHRPAQPLAGAADRVAMAEIVARAHHSWTVSDTETRRDGPSYTFDTLAEFADRGLTPVATFFIIGSDAFAEIAMWSRYPAVLDLAHFVVVARSGTTLESLRKQLPDLAGRMTSAGHFVPGSRLPTPDSRGASTSILLIETVTPDVSSTEIRRRVRAGEHITGLVAAGVESYIMTHRLYVGR